MAKKRSVGVIVAWITAGSVVATALISGVFALVLKNDTFEVGLSGEQAQSIEELNAIIVDRWRKIDQFLGVLVTSPTFNDVERGQLAGMRERLREKHDLHAAALQEGNLVLAYERLRDLQSYLNDVDKRISDLRTGHPDILPTLSGEFLKFWRHGVAGIISYQPKNQGILDMVKRWVLGD